MNFNHTITFKIAADPSLTALLASALPLLQTGVSLMSVISDHLDALEAKITDATNRVTADIAALKAQVSDLQAKVDAGSATPEDLTRLDALTAKLDQIDPTTPSVVPAP